MSKITINTVKSFINKNKSKLFIKCETHFDGMTDCIQSVGDDTFSPALNDTDHPDHTKGVHGAWFVGGSRDYLYAYSDNGFTGIKISNCCGSFILAIKDQS